MKPYILLTIVAAAALVAFRLADADFWFGAAAKMAASTGFILAALAGRALQTGYGHAIVAGLAFSWMGDAFLLGPNDTWFTLGLISFLLGHILYSVAFLVFSVNLRYAAAGALVVGTVSVVAGRWILSHVEGELWYPVLSYIVVISIMVALSVGAWGRGGHWSMPLGAAMFFVSDLAVATDQFVGTGFPNYVWGLPLYFGGQLFLAGSTAYAAKSCKPRGGAALGNASADSL